MDVIKKIIKLLLSFSSITLVIAIAAFLSFWMKPSLAAFLFVILAAVFLLIILSRRAYLDSQNVRWRLSIFAALFLSGFFIYCNISVDDISNGDDKCLRVGSSINRVIATFFPSRGGFEKLGTSENDNPTSKDSRNPNCESKANTDSQHKGMKHLYYAWHLCV